MITISISGQEKLDALLNDLRGLPEERELLSATAFAAEEHTRQHLYKKDSQPNKMGAKKTGYYKGAAEATSSSLKGRDAIITVKQRGIRQRLLGGVITPKKAKYLTIPLSKAARGKRASEFDNLILVGKQKKFLVRDRGNTTDLMYALVKRVDQAPDPTVLPEPGQLLITATGAAMDYLDAKLT